VLVCVELACGINEDIIARKGGIEMPDWLQAIIFFGSALVLLRIAGSRTFSQRSPGEVVIMIGLGTVLVHPLKDENPWMAVYHGALIVGALLVLSFIQIYFPKTKKWVLGEPIVLVKDGQVLEGNLKRARMTVDELKMRFRVKKVNDIAKVRMATLEVGGDLGVEMYPADSNATKKDIEDLKRAIELIGSKINATPVFYTPPSDPKQNLFVQAEEVQEKDPLQ
jgi:uncharacterized membrane protein YcaP (DUF421 family)